MKNLNLDNYENIFRIHLNNTLNYKKSYACFKTVGSTHNLVKNLNEIILNMSVQLNMNILESDDVFYNYLEVISKVYSDDSLDQVVENFQAEVDLVLKQKGA